MKRISSESFTNAKQYESMITAIFEEKSSHRRVKEEEDLEKPPILKLSNN